MMEHKSRETEMLVTRMVEEAERRQSEAENLRREVAQVILDIVLVVQFLVFVYFRVLIE